MLQHVSLETRPEDADAAAEFWALLGFARIETPPLLRRRAVWLEREGTHIHLLLTADPVVPPAGHSAVLVRDYDATLAALQAAGHPVEAHAQAWGVPRAFTRDPTGHQVELMSAPPPSY